MRFLRPCVALLPALLLIPLSLPAQNSPAHAAELDKDMNELQHYTLNMDTVQRAMETMYAVGQLVKSDPELQRESKDGDNDDQKTLGQMAQLLSKSPKLVALLSQHGFTPRTFVVAEMSMIQTSMAVAALDAGAKASDLTTKAQVNAANLKLFQDHRAELDALGKKYPMSGS